MEKIFRPRLFLLFIVLLSNLIFSQDTTYYNSISASSPAFISDLEARIRSPYIRISYDQYDETNVANFASRDTLDGKKVLTCVYSGENYVYTPPFSWAVFSREHTWCQNWMPSRLAADFTNFPEYSDQHHLFPSDQNNANQKRSDYPLGIVKTPSYTYLQAKLGANANGSTVFEPRDVHKGDAARALLYMCLKYDGIGGYTWNFNSLNTRLSQIGEGPEDLNTLLEWNRQDPPDKWEVDRNNYIQSVQKNRNPFVDHPEYVNYINFNDLTLKTPVFAKEPENQLSNLAASSTDSTITITWTDAAPGLQAPSGYLLMVFSKNNYFIPIDGSVYSDDTDLSDGKAVVNVPYSAADSFTFKKLKPATDYFITVYSDNGSDSLINYNIKGMGAKAKVRTTGSPDTKVFFPSYSASVSEGSGVYSLNVAISDPSPSVPTIVEVALTSGKSSAVGNYSAQTLTFPAGNSSPQTVSLTITDDAIDQADQILTFSLRNVSGGFNALTGTPGVFYLTINDNDGGTVGGLENFANFPEKSNSYGSGTFTGNDGSVWTYSSCANANPITTPSPVMKKGASPLAKVESGSISGGCGTISFKYMQAFSTNVNLGVYVNNTLIGTVTSNAETGTVKNSGPITANVAGDFKLKLEQVNLSSGQVTVDDIAWTGYTSTSVENNEENILPVSFSLSQNFPNPFNPETRIGYSLAENCRVTLKVYDLMGREVAELVNENKPAGNYEVKFNAARLSSGMYIYQLTAGSNIITKKLSLLK